MRNSNREDRLFMVHPVESDYSDASNPPYPVGTISTWSGTKYAKVQRLCRYSSETSKYWDECLKFERSYPYEIDLIEQPARALEQLWIAAFQSGVDAVLCAFSEGEDHFFPCFHFCSSCAKKGKLVFIAGESSFYGGHGCCMACREEDRRILREEEAENARLEAIEIQRCLGTKSVVYYIGTSEEIKIGYSKNLEKRLQTLQGARGETLQVFACEPGARSVERRRHAQFSHLRRKGEWFTHTGKLKEHIETLAQKDLQEGRP